MCYCFPRFEVYCGHLDVESVTSESLGGKNDVPYYDCIIYRNPRKERPP